MTLVKTKGFSVFSEKGTYTAEVYEEEKKLKDISLSIR
jgi:hypothetical protein